MKPNPPTANIPTIKKAAIRQDQPLNVNMNYINSIEPDSKNPLDNHEGRGASSHREVNPSGATGMIETLKDSRRCGYVKSLEITSAEPPNKRQNNTPNKPLKTPRVIQGYVHRNDLIMGVDQVTLTFDNPYYRSLANLTERYFTGLLEPQHSTGFYTHRWVAMGTEYSILTGHRTNDQLSQIYIPAKCMNTLTVDRRIEFLNDALELGARSTRIDVYADFIGECVTLVEESIEHAKYAKSTRLKHTYIKSTLDQINQGITLYLGSRKSNRMWRFYDKGIEVGSVGNVWQRVEVELRKDYADQALHLLTNGDDYKQTMLSLVFDDAAWDTQPPYWREAAAGKHDIVLSAKNELITLQRFRDWLVTNVEPKVRMLSRETGIPRNRVYGILTSIAPDDTMSEARRHKELIDQFRVLTSRQAS